jgi:hypothetical protein
MPDLSCSQAIMLNSLKSNRLNSETLRNVRQYAFAGLVLLRGVLAAILALSPGLRRCARFSAQIVAFIDGLDEGRRRILRRIASEVEEDKDPH